MSEQDAADAETDPETAEESEAGDAAEEVSVESAPDGVDPAAVDLDDVTAEPDAELVDRVAEADPEQTAGELAALRARVDALEADLDERDAEIEELESKLKRKQADFQNFKKRMEKRREQERERATEDLVERLLDVRDNLERALEQDEDTDIRGGVESTFRQLDDVLAAENVAVIDPEPGTAVDPEYHQVLAQVESDAEPGTIADVHRPGYEMADKVLREAQVTVSEE